jgi:glycolate oxidase
MSHIAFPRLDETILARRAEIVARLAAILPPECLIADESGRRAFETDALTAYRRLPLAVALPRSTEEVARVMRLCRDEKVNVVPRGAGTSLSGGAIPQEDAVVIALTKMSRILEVNLADRHARVEAGVTNLAISEAVGPEGFFYAPDPSSQLACTIGGNIAMNSGAPIALNTASPLTTSSARASSPWTARSSISAARRWTRPATISSASSAAPKASLGS